MFIITRRSDMAIISSVLIGYLLGCLHPAALLAKIKQKNLREHGTKNLGATNVSMVIGTKWGILVLLLDMAKGFISVKIASYLFPKVACAGLLAGVCAVVGHVFPFYLKFKGGKGLATFGGIILAYDPAIFLIVTLVGAILAVIVNYTCAFQYSVAGFFCLLATLSAQDLTVFWLTAAVGALIMWKHFENVVKAKNGTDVKIRDSIKKLVNKKR